MVLRTYPDTGRAARVGLASSLTLDQSISFNGHLDLNDALIEFAIHEEQAMVRLLLLITGEANYGVLGQAS